MAFLDFNHVMNEVASFFGDWTVYPGEAFSHKQIQQWLLSLLLVETDVVVS